MVCIYELVKSYTSHTMEQQNNFNELAEKMMKGEITASQASAEFKRREEGSIDMVGALNYHIKWVAELQREIQALKASAEKKSLKKEREEERKRMLCGKCDKCKVVGVKLNPQGIWDLCDKCSN